MTSEDDRERSPDDTGVILEARGIKKSFGHVEALQGVDFSVGRREVVGLIGDNGAGKSTLIKVLSGSIQADSGEVLFDGQRVQHSSAVKTRRLGVETVYQDLALADDLDPVANLFLGREILRDGLLGRLGVLDKGKMRRRTGEAFSQLGVEVPSLSGAVATLSGGQRQGVAVGRAITWASKVVFMDEPTAALGVRQTALVMELIRSVRDSGKSVVLISHNIPEVLEVTDRIEVLRLGRRVAQLETQSTSTDEIVAAMTGASARRDASS